MSDIGLFFVGWRTCKRPAAVAGVRARFSDIAFLPLRPMPRERKNIIVHWSRKTPGVPCRAVAPPRH